MLDDNKYIVLKWSEINGANSIVQNFKWYCPTCKKAKNFKNDLMDRWEFMTFQEYEDYITNVKNKSLLKSAKELDRDPGCLPCKYWTYCWDCKSNLELLSGEFNE